MLKDKIALVTGGANGIGAGITKCFVEAGARVGVGDIDLENGEKFIRSLNENARFYRMNVCDEEEIKTTVDQVFNDFGRIDILVNNAGITNDKLLLRMTRDDWEKVLAINLTGTFLVTRAVLKYMIKQRYGRIINIASIAGIIGNPGQANYSASKAGIIGFTKSCAKEFASRAITVNAIAPGFIETNMTAMLPDEVKNNYLKAIPMKRFGRVEDVAGLALFLASEQASYITGQVICLDGGLVM